MDVISIPNSRVAEALPDKTITDVIDHVGRNDPAIAEHNALVVALVDGRRSLTRELLDLKGCVLLKISPNENSVSIIWREVQPGDRRVEADGIGRGERERAQVISVACQRTIRERH